MRVYGPTLPEVDLKISKPDSDDDASLHERRTCERLRALASSCRGAASVARDPGAIVESVGTESGPAESGPMESGAPESG
jgi:hypothetical protein